MASFPVPDEYKIVRHVQSVRTYVTELDQSNTPNGLSRVCQLGFKKIQRQFFFPGVAYLLHSDMTVSATFLADIHSANNYGLDGLARYVTLTQHSDKEI